MIRGMGDATVLALAPHVVEAAARELAAQDLHTPARLFVPVFPVAVGGSPAAALPSNSFVIQGLFDSSRQAPAVHGPLGLVQCVLKSWHTFEDVPIFKPTQMCSALGCCPQRKLGALRTCLKAVFPEAEAAASFGAGGTMRASWSRSWRSQNWRRTSASCCA